MCAQLSFHTWLLRSFGRPRNDCHPSFFVPSAGGSARVRFLGCLLPAAGRQNTASCGPRRRQAPPAAAFFLASGLTSAAAEPRLLVPFFESLAASSSFCSVSSFSVSFAAVGHREIAANNYSSVPLAAGDGALASEIASKLLSIKSARVGDKTCRIFALSTSACGMLNRLSGTVDCRGLVTNTHATCLPRRIAGRAFMLSIVV